MRSVKPLLVLAVFGACGLLVWKFFLQPEPRATPPPPPAAPRRGLSTEVRERLERTSDLEFPEALRLAAEAARGSPAELELRALFAERARRALAALEERTEALLSEFRYREAAELVESYRARWRASPIEQRIAELLDAIREEQAAQVESRAKEAGALVEAGRFEAAREALLTNWALEAPFAERLSKHAQHIEGRIRARSPAGIARPVAPEAPPAAAPTVRAQPSPPPALPGFPHPDVKRLRDARALYAKAHKAFEQGRHQRAADALSDLIGYYADLPFVKKRREAIAAMNALARHGASGLRGLFHATEVKRRKGRRIRLVYRFESEEEMLDWETMPTIPHQGDGRFRLRRGAVQGFGTTTFLLRAFFENDVRIRCVSRPKQLRSHGLGFCQQDLETRQILLLVTNHWFTEGENYVKPRPGHSLLMIGKGTNSDVPVDAPEVGFIFKGPSYERPSPPAGADLGLAFALVGRRMTGDVAYKLESTTLRQDAVGDDGRSIERVRPALFVVEADVLFRDVWIEGTLHESFESRRVDELLRMLEE